MPAFHFAALCLASFVATQILLCANHLRREESAVETTVHEMVHSFDACRAKVDWRNPAHRACSEVCARHQSPMCIYALTKSNYLRFSLDADSRRKSVWRLHIHS